VSREICQQKSMRNQQKRSIRTQEKIIEAFRTLVLEHGYDGTTTQMVLDHCGLSKGAMYHQFRSKSDLMAALYEREATATLDAAWTACAKDEDPLAKLFSFYLAWVEQVRSPPVARLLFEIGPFALGYEGAKTIEDRTSATYIEGLLETAMEQGAIRAVDLKLLAGMLNALVGEAALYHHRTGHDTDEDLSVMLKGALTAVRKD